MRGRLVEAHQAARDEIWALKHGAGGLMDIEFVAQNGVLAASMADAASAYDALGKLAEQGAIANADAEALREAYLFQSRLQHVERIALAGSFRAESAGEGLKVALSRAGGVADFDALEARLAQLKEIAAEIADRALPLP